MFSLKWPWVRKRVQRRGKVEGFSAMVNSLGKGLGDLPTLRFSLTRACLFILHLKLLMLISSKDLLPIWLHHHDPSEDPSAPKLTKVDAIYYDTLIERYSDNEFRSISTKSPGYRNLRTEIIVSEILIMVLNSTYITG
jgi:hypothetical protein